MKSNKYDSLKLENQVCFPLYACSKELIRQYNPHLQDLGLTYTQYIVMMVLWEKGEASSRELAESLHLDYGTLTPVLKRMEQSGYIVRTRSADDERLLTLSLTEEGLKLKEKALDVPRCMSSVMGLTREEYEQLYKLTYKALYNMESLN